MLAGTILVSGEGGKNVGVGMKRGTICFARSKPPKLLPTFRLACVAPAPVLGIVGRQLQSLSFKNDVWHTERQWQQYSGDFLASGRGEIFLAD
jgi:formylmethanofuran dehydrogenase subunit C